MPAHSCILSAISPQLSTALSSKTLPPAGQRHHLEFGTMSACTLLHMVRLLYSGEMAGEGEEEKQKAISAAAKMGIHGLVEVTQQDRTRRAEVGVQTEPLTSEEDEVRHVKWRRGVQDGSTVLWKETQPAGAINFPTLTEELQVNAAPAEAPYETIDMASLQSLQQTNSHLLTHQFPYVPISVICSQDENHLPQTCSDPAACFQESPPEGHIPVPTPSYPSVPFSLPHAGPTTQLSADCHAWLSTRQAAGKHLAPGKEFSDKQIETFQDNIPGFINYFLNPHEETFRGGRARRKRRARRARMSRASERRARAPRVRGGGRWQGRLTQTVAVQEVGVSKMQKLHVQRLGRHTCRTGQGGGAVGRKSCLKTRQHLKPTGRRGRCGKGLDFSPSGELHHGGTQGGNTWSRRTTSQHANHVSAAFLCSMTHLRHTLKRASFIDKSSVISFACSLSLHASILLTASNKPTQHSPLRKTESMSSQSVEGCGVGAGEHLPSESPLCIYLFLFVLGYRPAILSARRPPLPSPHLPDHSTQCRAPVPPCHRVRLQPTARQRCSSSITRPFLLQPLCLTWTSQKTLTVSWRK